MTHQLQYLKRADRLIILHDGALQIEGTYDEILKSGVSFAEFLQEAAAIAADKREEEKEVEKVLRAISRSSAALNSMIDIEGLKVREILNPF